MSAARLYSQLCGVPFSLGLPEVEHGLGVQMQGTEKIDLRAGFSVQEDRLPLDKA